MVYEIPIGSYFANRNVSTNKHTDAGGDDVPYKHNVVTVINTPTKGSWLSLRGEPFNLHLRPLITSQDRRVTYQ